MGPVSVKRDRVGSVRTPLTVFGGLRKLCLGRLFLEGGAGAGLIERSSHDFAFAFTAGWLF